MIDNNNRNRVRRFEDTQAFEPEQRRIDVYHINIIFDLILIKEKSRMYRLLIRISNVKVVLVDLQLDCHHCSILVIHGLALINSRKQNIISKKKKKN